MRAALDREDVGEHQRLTGLGLTLCKVLTTLLTKVQRRKSRERRWRSRAAEVVTRARENAFRSLDAERYAAFALDC